MKFQKGSKVEVMNKTELPTSWCVAEIVSGNRHTYNLRYDCYPGVEKVSREFIRPCPPLSNDFQSWIAGDIVEVFDDNDNSWKTATVCKVTDQGHFSVRPHGFTHERNVPKSEIRTRQSWQDGHWVPIVKISGSYGDVNAKNCQENDNDVGFQESRVVSSKTLKRASPFCSSPGNAKKLKENRRRLIPNQSLEKVDAFGFACANEKNLNGFYEPEKEKLNVFDGCSLSRIPEPDNTDDTDTDTDNDECSVGSCSVSSYGQNKSTSPCKETDNILSSDAESFNTSTPSWAESIHRLELHGYRSTLEALYASGPLSWEKEALLTNLRINLHISNDEHLTELRHLISSGAGFLDYQ
ncbi:uncharacterized protein LOC111908031 isoform X1 [Lactuca sativa]|uniref:ENT domain-containing protein n=1 Tax=Lactuca sativa TaxID=4236 RepID=A0A9R1V8Z0_LACSA|nr:uncharacterized protein LOC111908031 isoform X1 [Lactuca sativa]XP_023759612.1 uncharacterized protein LOC111908031 isoform X1 [Lactuca sativa]KAJ0202582.1 hypothetical protein LSAT_V11C500239950 [Lactuca sativa]